MTKITNPPFEYKLIKARSISSLGGLREKRTVALALNSQRKFFWGSLLTNPSIMLKSRAKNILEEKPFGPSGSSERNLPRPYQP